MYTAKENTRWKTKSVCKEVHRERREWWIMGKSSTDHTHTLLHGWVSSQMTTCLYWWLHDFDAGRRWLVDGNSPLLGSSPVEVECVPGLGLGVLSGLTTGLTTVEEPPLADVSLVLYELAIMRMSLGDGPPVRVMTVSLLMPSLTPSIVSLDNSDTDSWFCLFPTCRMFEEAIEV